MEIKQKRQTVQTKNIYIYEEKKKITKMCEN